MELTGMAHTAEELFQFLLQIPQEQRKRLPVEVLEDEDDELDGTEVHLSAFEVTETEGCIERGFRLTAKLL